MRGEGVLGVSHSGFEGCEGASRGRLWGNPISQLDGRREKRVDVSVSPGLGQEKFVGLTWKCGCSSSVCPRLV